MAKRYRLGLTVFKDGFNTPWLKVNTLGLGFEVPITYEADYAIVGGGYMVESMHYCFELNNARKNGKRVDLNKNQRNFLIRLESKLQAVLRENFKAGSSLIGEEQQVRFVL